MPGIVILCRARRGAKDEEKLRSVRYSVENTGEMTPQEAFDYLILPFRDHFPYCVAGLGLFWGFVLCVKWLGRR